MITPLNELYDIITKSNFNLIGYNYREERGKNEFLKKFNPLYINHEDSIRSYIRDHRIDNIVGSNNTTFDSFVVDLSGLKSDYRFTQHITEQLRADSITYNAQIIATVAVNYNVNTGVKTKSSALITAMRPSLVYPADVVAVFFDNDLNIIKNRYGREFTIENYKQYLNI